MSSDDYFKSYRHKLRELENYKDTINKLNIEVASIRNKVIGLQNECIKMRTIITIMIEEGIDDVEARLRDEKSTVSLWESESISTSTSRSYPYYQSMSSISGNPFASGSIENAMSSIGSAIPLVPNNLPKL